MCGARSAIADHQPQIRQAYCVAKLHGLGRGYDGGSVGGVEHKGLRDGKVRKHGVVVVVECRSQAVGVHGSRAPGDRSLSGVGQWRIGREHSERSARMAAVRG